MFAFLLVPLSKQILQGSPVPDVLLGFPASLSNPPIFRLGPRGLQDGQALLQLLDFETAEQDLRLALPWEGRRTWVCFIGNPEKGWFPLTFPCLKHGTRMSRAVDTRAKWRGPGWDVLTNVGVVGPKPQGIHSHLFLEP